MNTKNPMADMMKFWSDYKAPELKSFDFNTVVACGRRNAETVTAAGQAVSESCQAIARRQAELARAQVEKVLKGTKEMLVNGSPEINTTKQAALVKSVIESSLNNLREVSELVTKSSFEVFDLLNKRANESLEEISTVAPAAKKKAAA